MTDRDGPPQTHGSAAASRRTVLRAAGLVTLAGGAGAALTACSSDAASPAASTAPSSAPATGESSAASPSTTSPSSTSPSAVGSSPAKTSAKVPSGPSVATADVPVGGAVILPNADYVVTQPKKGSYKAFSKICTHQGCPVQAIINHEIVCKCHNSHFSIEDGSVLSGPAQKALPAAKTTVAGDKIVITT